MAGAAVAFACPDGKRQKPKVGSGCSEGKRQKWEGDAQKAKGKSGKGMLNAFRHLSGGHLYIFYLLPFAFYLSWCCFSPQSKIQNRESKIMCRPFGDPNWVTDTGKRLGLECTVRPRGRPKEQS